MLALKDPRLCRTLPAWSAALGRQWITHGMAIMRDPASVIGSIGYRDDMPPLKALALWLRHNLELVETRQLDPAIAHWPLLSFERLISGPARELRSALEHWRKLGLEVQLEPQQPLAIRELPQPPSSLPQIPETWLSIAQSFHQVLKQAHSLGAVPEEAWIPCDSCSTTPRPSANSSWPWKPTGAWCWETSWPRSAAASAAKLCWGNRSGQFGGTQQSRARRHHLCAAQAGVR